jgi:hypothetical protein
MIHWRNLLVGLLALVLVACAGTPTPETPREKLVAAEATYSTLLDDVRSAATSGIIEPGSETAHTVAALLVEARAALDAWQADPDNPNMAVFVQKSLERLKALLLRLSQESRAPPIDDSIIVMAGGFDGLRVVT